MERVPPRRAFAFGHGVSHDLGDGVRLFCSYHPSQQNTFTGKLTPADLDRVLADVRGHVREVGERRCEDRPSLGLGLLAVTAAAEVRSATFALREPRP